MRLTVLFVNISRSYWVRCEVGRRVHTHTHYGMLENKECSQSTRNDREPLKDRRRTRLDGGGNHSVNHMRDKTATEVKSSLALSSETVEMRNGRKLGGYTKVAEASQWEQETCSLLPSTLSREEDSRGTCLQSWGGRRALELKKQGSALEGRQPFRARGSCSGQRHKLQGHPAQQSVPSLHRNH